MNKNRKRPQAQKVHRHANPEMAAAMRGLRMSSAADYHRDRTKYSRNDERRAKQRGEW